MLEIRQSQEPAVASEYLMELASVLSRVSSEALSQAIALVLQTRAAGRRVYLIGNGGSASTASHLACDLMKTAHVAGLEPIRAFALADNAALVTAWANDTTYERIFSAQLESLIDEGDLVVAISASGRSPNVVNGLRAAARRGARTIALLGFDGGACLDLAEIVVHVPCNHYGLVEDAHSAIGHAMTAAVRRALEQEAAGRRLPG